jgi:hypothetical protein
MFECIPVPMFLCLQGPDPCCYNCATLIVYNITKLYSVADPDQSFGAFLPPGSGIRDVAMIGSRISKQNLLIAFIQK